MLKDELNKLSTNDIYSLILFVILQLKKIPEYAVLSELIYSVDHNSLLNMCKQFGGTTIKVPTLDELETIVDALLLYCYVNLEHKSYEDGINLVTSDSSKIDNIKCAYLQILEVISDYDFRR